MSDAQTITETQAAEPSAEPAGEGGGREAAARTLPGRPARGPRRWVVPVLAAVLALLLAVIAVLGQRLYVDHRTEEARSEALTAARLAAVDVLSYDYRRIDRDLARALRHLTPSFAEEYKETMVKAVKPTARKTHGVVDAEVVGASVASATPDRVVTLLFVNQTSSTNLKSGKTTSLNRVRMTMERDDDGRWLVDEIEAL